MRARGTSARPHAASSPPPAEPPRRPPTTRRPDIRHGCTARPSAATRRSVPSTGGTAPRPPPPAPDRPRRHPASGRRISATYGTPQARAALPRSSPRPRPLNPSACRRSQPCDSPPSEKACCTPGSRPFTLSTDRRNRLSTSRIAGIRRIRADGRRGGHGPGPGSLQRRNRRSRSQRRPPAVQGSSVGPNRWRPSVRPGQPNPPYRLHRTVTSVVSVRSRRNSGPTTGRSTREPAQPRRARTS